MTVVLESAKRIHPGGGDDDSPGPTDAFTNVVDLDDVAPFCNAGPRGFIWGQITNGLTSADDWVFIYEHNIKGRSAPQMDGSSCRRRRK